MKVLKVTLISSDVIINDNMTNNLLSCIQKYPFCYHFVEKVLKKASFESFHSWKIQIYQLANIFESSTNQS